MNGYQFEDYISEYIENTLSIVKRKEFEKYLSENPQSKDQVAAVKSTISQLRNLPKVRTSPDFSTKLRQRIAEQGDSVLISQTKRRPMIFGFTPLTAGMMSLVVMAIVFVGYALMPNGSGNPVAIPNNVTTNSMLPTVAKSAPINTVNSTTTVVAKAEEDTSEVDEDLQRIDQNLKDKINYVRTK